MTSADKFQFNYLLYTTANRVYKLFFDALKITNPETAYLVRRGTAKATNQARMDYITLQSQTGKRWTVTGMDRYLRHQPVNQSVISRGLKLAMGNPDLYEASRTLASQYEQPRYCLPNQKLSDTVLGKSIKVLNRQLSDENNFDNRMATVKTGCVLPSRAMHNYVIR